MRHESIGFLEVNQWKSSFIIENVQTLFLDPQNCFCEYAFQVSVTETGNNSTKGNEMTKK